MLTINRTLEERIESLEAKVEQLLKSSPGLVGLSELLGLIQETPHHDNYPQTAAGRQKLLRRLRKSDMIDFRIKTNNGCLYSPVRILDRLYEDWKL